MMPNVWCSSLLGCQDPTEPPTAPKHPGGPAGSAAGQGGSQALEETRWVLNTGAQMGQGQGQDVYSLRRASRSLSADEAKSGMGPSRSFEDFLLELSIVLRPVFNTIKTDVNSQRVRCESWFNCSSGLYRCGNLNVWMHTFDFLLVDGNGNTQNKHDQQDD